MLQSLSFGLGRVEPCSPQRASSRPWATADGLRWGGPGVLTAESTVGTEAPAESVGAGTVDSPGSSRGSLPRSRLKAAVSVAASSADVLGFSFQV